MRKPLLLVGLLLASFAHADKVDDFIKVQMDQQKIPGMVVEIVWRGKVVKKKAYGKSDLELNVPMKTDNIFEIGSITKQFTATATMLLVEEGKIGLDDPVSKYIADTPEAWKNITIRHLLNQTSGLKEYVFVPGLGLLDEYNQETFLKGMKPLPLDFEPGVTWAYSNTNYALLGIVIEKASGKSYSDFITERLLKPAGMTSTRVLNPDEIIERRAHGYMKDGPNLYRARFSMLSNIADGALLSSADDMVKWDAALHGGKILKPESLALMMTPAKLNSGRARPYGFGTFREQIGMYPFAGHHGASPGFSAGYGHFPSENMTVVVMTNVYAINGQSMVMQLAELVEPKLKPAPPVAIADPDTARTERLKTALGKLAAGNADSEYFEPEFTALMGTDRTKSVPGYAPFAKIQSMEFAGARPEGSDTVLTYRIVTEPRTFIANVVYTGGGKVATIALRPEGPPRAASAPSK